MNPTHPRLGEVVVCACGATSPASDRNHVLDAWEDEHTQWECTHVVDRVWDEAIEDWTLPVLPAMTRHTAEVPITPEQTPARRPRTGRRRTHWRPA